MSIYIHDKYVFDIKNISPNGSDHILKTFFTLIMLLRYTTDDFIVKPQYLTGLDE